MQTVFTPDMAVTIMQTPVAQTNLEDTFIWFYDPRGTYSVKAGYMLAWNNKLYQFDEGPNLVTPTSLR